MNLQSKDLSRRLTFAILAPVALLIALGALLGAQVLRMSEDAAWVEHTDVVLTTAQEAETRIVDQEAALRGYLLTEDRVFLDSFTKARTSNALRQLRVLVSDNPAQLAALDEIERLADAWNAAADRIAQGGAAEGRQPASIFARRQLMYSLREHLASFRATENVLRDKRAAASAASVATTRALFLVLFLGAAVFLGVFSRRQLRAITGAYGKALEEERATREQMEAEAWIREGQGRIADAVQGELSIEELGERVLASLAGHTKAEIGAFFTVDGGALRRRAGYALDARAGGADTFARGEGLVGRAAEADAVLHVTDEFAEEAPRIRAGTGERLPRELVLAPLRLADRPFGVIELGYQSAAARVLELLERVGETVAVAIRSADYRARLRELLEESQRQAEELQTQQEELRVANEELEEQSKAVREAQARLEERQEELTTANARLEEQAHDLEAARAGALEKAEALGRASRYKSEFLANMSHELRTPLNSSLILAKLLADNKDGNLTGEQVKFAETIYGAGNDLLTLINDILDLSKIEAGHLDVKDEVVPLERLQENTRRLFEAIAQEKGLAFSVIVDPDAPRSVVTDGHRVEQILKNLVSNALKFTEKGEVEVRLSKGPRSLRVAVRDTGIGIAPHQHELVFEAFRQADGASNRKYGGTGLGLSISRDLARLLGGDLVVASEIGVGSTFVLTIPERRSASIGAPALGASPPPEAARLPPPSTVAPSVVAAPRALPPPPRPIIDDDRGSLDRTRRVVLVIEDDVRFAQILVDLAHERGFQCVVAGTADDGIALAIETGPSAIILDINLPDHSGLSVLDRLKRTPATRHVPVHVMSVADHPQRVLSMGAAAFLQKPVKREELLSAFERLEEGLAASARRLLVVEDDPVQRDSLTKLLASDSVQIVAVGTVAEALTALRNGTFDCVVTDLSLPDESGFDLLEKMAAEDGKTMPPVIVYTGKNLSPSEESALRRYSSSIIVKGARSPERLLDEVTLFLHQVEEKLPLDRQRMLKQARDREAVLEGRTILVVEDDVRNIFALSSVLEPRGAKVIIARNGVEALAALEKNPGVELVLMDIMMPEMDGLAATREIRRRKEWAKLPIIALTAKAMKDDQERCLRAGANDYISKPLDVEMLLSLLRVWLPR